MNIHQSWQPFFDDNKQLLDDITSQIDLDNVVPSKDNIYKIFRYDMNKIKVVFLGMDPYPNPNNAMGLAFSVYRNVSIPGSLKNIYKELQNEFPERNYVFTHGDLTRWIKEEGIFLYNCALTTIPWKSGSHLQLWKPFSDNLIKYLSNNPNIVFILLGNNAIQKKEFIKHQKNIVSATHPSPLSAHNGFFGSDIFKKVEAIIGKSIDWSI